MASAAGRVTFAGWSAGGWGYLVTIAHSNGVRTLYAHLSRVGVHVGQWVEAGQRVGRVGASGHAFGPHLHFEVRLRGAAVDPLTGLF
jgi:murein DD-endopeptidase MepM/ murein hydrolase activator NlpD